MSTTVELDPVVKKYLDQVTVLDSNDAVARLLYVTFREVDMLDEVQDLVDLILANDIIIGENDEQVQ